MISHNDFGLSPELIRQAAGDPTLTVTSADVARTVETIRTLCGWHIAPRRRETLTVDSYGDDFIILPSLCVEKIYSIRLNEREIPPSQWEFSRYGVVEFTQRLPRALGRLHVDVEHGFETIPELVGVAANMAARASAPASQMSVGGISMGGAGAPTPLSTEWRILDHYKLGALP